jgi:hypothetical protein
MSTQLELLIEQLQKSNTELSQYIQDENWDSSNTTLNARAMIIDELRQLSITANENEILIIRDVFQKMAVSEKCLLDVAENQKQDTANQIKKLKNAQKALPAYQENEK